MGDVFSTSQISTAKFWYEKIPYTLLVSSLPTATTNVFSVTSVQQAAGNMWYARMCDVAATQNNLVQLTLSNTTDSSQIATSGLPGNLLPAMQGEDDGIFAVNSLSANVYNNTGSTVSNFQLNYAVAMRRATTAEKILRGIPLTAQDLAYQKEFNLPARGLRPLPVSTMLKRAFLGQVKSTKIQSVVNTAPASTPIINEVAREGEILVLKRLSSSVVTVGNQVSITVSRDQDTNYVSVLADNIGGVGVDMWLPALQTLNINLSAVTQTTNVTVYAEFLRIHRSPLIDMLFGRVDPSTLAPSDKATYDRAMAGELV